MTERTVMSHVSTLVNSLKLESHPEGGWFRRTWTAPERLVTPRGERATASAILFLLDKDMEAAWHVVHSDELWLWHGPGDLEVHLGGSGDAPSDSPRIVTLSAQPLMNEDDAGQSGANPPVTRGVVGTTDVRNPVQILVKAGTWQRTFARGSHALATCVVSPEFTYDDWKLAQ
ncbi:cupin domain-containing protein [Schaalia sp. ZJ1691]|uniref:cupin domain-containing protein n=1 Tax=Schaalia sp. ZJ1691 TaxID=2709404 RepID=UPI001F14A956|nr:cupin domain-containing protein [Schaalia sp. ZJ1691]